MKNIGVDPGNSNFSSKDGVLFDKTQSTLCFFPWGQAADSYTIPSSVKTIGNSAFAEYPLQEIVLPDHIEKIEPKAFSNCSKLSKIRFPNNEAFLIGEGAFLDCRALTELSLPKNATSIGNAAFSGCSGLKKIGLDAANPNYTVSDGVLFDKAKTRLICYPAGRAETDYMVPAGVKVISSRSFLSCQYLVRAILPDGLTDIEEYAFAFCPALNTVNIPESVTTIGTGIFYGSPKMPYLPGVSFHSGVTEMPVTFSSHGHFVPRS